MMFSTRLGILIAVTLLAGFSVIVYLGYPSAKLFLGLGMAAAGSTFLVSRAVTRTLRDLSPAAAGHGKGSTVGLRGIGIDITGRRKAEREILKFESLVENSQDFIGIAALDGKLLYLNPAARSLVGLGKDEEITSKLITDLYFDEDVPRMLELIQRGRFQREELRVRHFGTHASIPVEMTGFTMMDMKTGLPFALGGIIRDITERKRTEDEILALNEELELKVEHRTRQLEDAQEELVRKEKLALLGQLSASVGHELRNPLGVMSNAVYYLKTVLPNADDTVKDYLNMLDGEIKTSDRIIADLLDFSRAKTPETKTVAAGELITRSLGRCLIPDRVAVQVTLPEALPKLRVDPLQMGQIFQNLITNAVQAMPGGGSLTIAAKEAVDENSIKISVADTGIGIPPENMKKIFQPLFTTKARGIGLGLLVSRNLAEANGGRLEVESRPGTGTTFTVMLPCERG